MKPATVIIAILCLPPVAALAQRNGDVSNGLDNQPTAGEVQSKERAAGVAQPPAQRQQQTGTVDNIYKELMTKERKDGQTDAPPDPNAPIATAPKAAPR